MLNWTVLRNFSFDWYRKMGGSINRRSATTASLESQRDEQVFASGVEDEAGRSGEMEAILPVQLLRGKSDETVAP